MTARVEFALGGDLGGPGLRASARGGAGAGRAPEVRASAPDGPGRERAPGAASPQEGAPILGAVGEAFEASRTRPSGEPSAPPTEEGPRSGVDRVLLEDPDPLRREAAAREAASAPLPVLRAALADPDDRVAAAVVPLIAARGPSSLALLLPHLGSRARPLTQAAALAALPELLRRAHGGQAAEALGAVGRLDPPPLPHEREPLRAAAQALGVPRLLAALDGPEEVRAGAARLLLAEGGLAALRALSGLDADPSPEVRRCARAARRELAAGGWASERAGAVLPDAEPDDGELLAALARALADPSPAVREGAARALRDLPAHRLVAWAVGALRAGAPPEATAAAAVAGTVPLKEAALPLLERAADTPPAERGAYLEALSSFDLGPTELARLVAAVDPSRRPAALWIAWQVGGTGFLGQVGPFLSDPAAPVRAAALELLDGAADPSSLDRARRLLLEDASPAVRAAAARLLVTAGPGPLQEALAAALVDPDPDVRSTALEALPPGLATEVGGLVASALGDPDERVWRSALAHLPAVPQDSLWRLLREGDAHWREEVLRAVLSSEPDRVVALALAHAADPDPAARSLAVSLAGRAAGPACGEPVLAGLRDPDPNVRRAAASALLTFHPPGTVDALVRALADPAVEVRADAVRALSRVDDDRVVDALLRALGDPEARVREAASDALARWSSPAVAGRLVEALRRPDLRRAAAEALARMETGVTSSLLRALAHDDPDVRGEAARVLGRLLGPEPFVRDLASLDHEARRRAVEALGGMGGATATRALLQALADPVPEVRARAARILGELRDPLAVAPLRRVFATDPVPEVAAAAGEALRALGAEEAPRGPQPGSGGLDDPSAGPRTRGDVLPE